MHGTPSYYTTGFEDPSVAYTALVGTSLGRRERHHGQLRTIAEVTISQIVEPVDDLAVADRIAYVMANRTGIAHLVIATAHTYLVVTVDQPLDGSDARMIAPRPGAPRLISVATVQGITPVL